MADQNTDADQIPEVPALPVIPLDVVRRVRTRVNHFQRKPDTGLRHTSTTPDGE